VLGKTGMGKSTFLLNCISQDIRAGRGCVVIDPKGDLALDILSIVPPLRRRDVIYFDPSDLDYPIGFNPLEAKASAVLTAFHHLFKDSWGPQLEQILKAAVLAVQPHGTLLDVKFLLTSKRLRERTIIRDPLVRDFWNTDFTRHMPEREQRERTLSTLNKVRQFLDDPLLRNIVSQPSAFELTDVIDSGKVFIANLAAGSMGQDNSALLGAFLISSIHSAALSRKRRDPFPVYVDEAYLFGSSAFAEMLSILRGLGVSLVLANQYIGQLDQRLRAALIGNVGTIIAFKVGSQDAVTLAPDFDRKPSDLTLIEPHSALARTGERTIELAMPPCTAKRHPSGGEKIQRQCRNQLALPRRYVEKSIKAFLATI
jgi:DNA helicase HerA-like ATPase